MGAVFCGHAEVLVDSNPRLRVCPIAATMGFRYCSNRLTRRSHTFLGCGLELEWEQFQVMLRTTGFTGGAGGNRTLVLLRSREGSSEQSKPNQPHKDTLPDLTQAEP